MAVLICICLFSAIPIQYGATNSEDPILFDEYGDVRLNDLRAHLDTFAVQLGNEPNSRGYIIGYGGKTRARACHGLALANRAKLYLVEKRGVQSSQITTVDGGYRDSPAGELWLARDSSAPTASRSVSSRSVRLSGPSLCGPAGRAFAQIILTAP